MTYRCEGCPLTIELGGFTYWEETGVVVSDTSQVACAACGTLHRITKERNAWKVTSLPGPIRTTRPATVRDTWDNAFEVEQWFSEDDWHEVAQFPPGFNADLLACGKCALVGQMLSLADFLYPEGYVPGASRVALCPLCHRPMQCIAVSDAI